MKNQLLAIFFYMLYLLAMVKPIMPLLEYYANYDYIAAVLCENRDKPVLECNGKCYLQSQIEKNDFKSSQEHNSSVPLISLDDYPISPLHSFAYKILDKDNNKINGEIRHNLTSQECHFFLLKPPQA